MQGRSGCVEAAGRHTTQRGKQKPSLNRPSSILRFTRQPSAPQLRRLHTCTCCLGDSCAGGWPTTTCTAGLGAASTRLTLLRGCAACLLPRKSSSSPVLRV